MTELISITYQNIDLLKQFIESMGDSNNTFKYFEKRSLDCISNHLITYILLNSEIPVAYGHLDKDGNDIWLGVCVTEKSRGQGFGKIMMDKLLKYCKNNNIKKIKLSVYKQNINAIKLYENLGFINTNSKENIIFMEKTFKLEGEQNV